MSWPHSYLSAVLRRDLVSFLKYSDIPVDLLFFNLGIAMTEFSHKWWTQEGYDMRCPEQDLGVMEILEK